MISAEASTQPCEQLSFNIENIENLRHLISGCSDSAIQDYQSGLWFETMSKAYKLVGFGSKQAFDYLFVSGSHSLFLMVIIFFLLTMVLKAGKNKWFAKNCWKYRNTFFVATSLESSFDLEFYK